MLKALLNVHFSGIKNNLFSKMTSRSKGDAAKGRNRALGLILLIAFFSIILEFSFSTMFCSIGSAFADIGAMWAYFVIFLIAAFVLMFIGSVFITKTTLFEAKDNNLLMCLPIKPSIIMAARTIILLIYSFIFETLMAIPAIIGYFVSGAATFGGVVAFILIYLTLPLFTYAISAVFAWLISLLTSRIRRKSIFVTVAYLIFFALYMFCCMKMGDVLMLIVDNTEAISSNLQHLVPLVWFGKAISEPNYLYLLGFIAAFIAIFALAYFIIASSFIKIVTTNHGSKKIKYKEKSVKQATPFKALVKREFTHLFASPIYFLNACLGVIFLIAFLGYTAYMAISPNDQLQTLIAVLSENFSSMPINDIVIGVVIVAICSISSMVSITPPSISIEGKTIWLLRSVPVSEKKILLSKLFIQLVLTVPFVILESIFAIIAFKPTVYSAIMIFLIPLAYSVFIAVLGLVTNLKHPKLDWMNESQAVKSSASVMITMFGGWIVTIVPVVLFLITKKFLPNPIWVEAIFLVGILIMVCLLLKNLFTKGVKELQNIS